MVQERITLGEAKRRAAEYAVDSEKFKAEWAATRPSQWEQEQARIAANVDPATDDQFRADIARIKQEEADALNTIFGKARDSRQPPPADPTDPGPGVRHLNNRGTINGQYAETLEPQPLQRALLGTLMRSGIPEPTRWHSWLYAGGLHTLQSEPGVGKSWLALWLTLHLIQDGYTVIYMDEEGGHELIVERLQALGANPDLVDTHLLYYPFPERAWTDQDLLALGEVIQQAGTVGQLAVGILDSLPDFLDAANLEENSGKDVTRFIRRLLRPFRDVDAALLVLDHLTKPDESSGSSKKRSRYSRGSGAKLAKAHLAILVETDTEFDTTTSGAVKVWKTKDRRGRVELPGLKHDPLILEVKVTDGQVRITPTERTPATKSEWDGPTECMNAILAFCAAHSDTRFTVNKLTDKVGFRQPTVKVAAALLHKNGDLRYELGPRNADTYWHQTQTEMGSDAF